MRIVATSLLLALSLAVTANAVEDAEVKSIYEQPILLTAAGQANDVAILKVLCLRAGLKVQMSPAATADSLNGFKTLILVAGGSSKGLGAAKVDVSDEHNRIKALAAAAAAQKIPVLVFHIGGDIRRGALSDPFNKQAAEVGEMIVVTADGDKDGFFKKIAAERKVQYRPIEKFDAAVDVLKELFLKPQS